MRRYDRTTRGRARRGLAIALLAAMLLALPGTLLAAPPSSLDEAVAQAEKDHAGRALSARGERRNGGVVYTIRLLTEDQQVRTITIQGAEGARP